MPEEPLAPDTEDQPQEPPITKEQIEDFLRTDPRFKSYFEAFEADSVDDFIHDYARQKKRWLTWGQFSIDQNEKAETQWMEEAARHLKFTLQKKLFDAQCLWRAEQATYEGVKICFDFKRWGENILHCPFLEPITEEEMRLYQQYLRSNNPELKSRLWDGWQDGDWQDYREIKAAHYTDNAKGNFPEWYDFHNGRTGAGVLMALPDLRGEKEDFYIKLAYDTLERPADDAHFAEWERTRDKRPEINSYDQKQIRHFVITFEDARTRALYEGFTYNHRNSEDRSNLEGIIRLLLDADEPIPTEKHADFRDALREAEHRYRLRKIAEHLPLAYEEYLLNQSLGLHSVDKERVEFYARLFQTPYNRILTGRRLAGEPEDLNF